MHRPLLRVLLLAGIAVVLSGCASSRRSKAIYMRQLARAGMRLGIDIDRKDDHPLMMASAEWMGTPYKWGGQTRAGVDCSGLSRALYSEVYTIQLPRTSQDQRKACRKRVKKARKLRSGDLVFFSPSGKKGEVNHVGVYLKDGRFIHASTSKGVMVSSLSEAYFQRTFAGGGRYKK